MSRNRFSILSLCLLLCFLCMEAAAQDHCTKVHKDSVRFGLQLGLGFTHFSGHDVNGDKFGNQNLVRFRGGANIDVPFNAFVSLRPELLLSMGGYKTDDSLNLKTHLSYLKIPANFVFKIFSINNNHGGIGSMKFGVGPYIAYALHGRYSNKSYSSAVKFSNRAVAMATDNYEAYFKRWDAGINCFIEFSGSNFYSQIGSSLGIVNIKPRWASPGNQALCRNASFNISYGWRF